MPDQCGPTHYTGCPCHEARRNRLLEAAEKVVEAAKQAMNNSGEWRGDTAIWKSDADAINSTLAAYDAIRKETERE